MCCVRPKKQKCFYVGEFVKGTKKYMCLQNVPGKVASEKSEYSFLVLVNQLSNNIHIAQSKDTFGSFVKRSGKWP